MQVSDRRVHGGKILLHDGFAALPIGLLDRFLDRGDRFLARQHSADREEAGLHDRVDAAAHARFARNGISIDHIELELLIQDLLLRFAREMVPNLIGGKWRIQQESRSWLGRGKHVHALQK